MTESGSNGPSRDDPTGQADVAALEQIDWDRVDSASRRFSLERIALVVGVLAVGLAYLYYRWKDSIFLVARWYVGPEDWLLLLALVVVVAYGAVPMIVDPSHGHRLLARLRRRWATVASLVVLGAVVLTAFYAMITGLQPRLTLESGTAGTDKLQPPVGFSGSYLETGQDCVGSVTGDSVYDQQCHGSWEYVLGTDRWGYEMVDLLVVGARPVAYAVLVTVGIIVPLATIVGLVAGYYGGSVDDLLMSYVDVQLSIPAIVIYMIAYLFIGDSFFVLLAAFGLLSWGGIARIVRSETLQRREEGYVLAARVLGASRPYVLRRHVLPNITNSVIPAAFHLMAVLVLTEAALAFLGFHATFQSWGMTMGEGLFRAAPLDTWWVSTLPAIALGLTVAAFKVAGDGLRDALDPRGTHD
ncbi:ABC transporter permease [Natronosalvus halobius]|uniref:ABC transporter permease n=1 Tax=Natronosalvus halobius TaxID=2953746 RepID=UPI0020A19A2C|nr:ABC transporter permease [Natronosalvus halobius]USZ72780.1 ABC transporter permease [Natronosalvus halobius]